MAPTAFSGSLQSKKKAELLEIALALQISDRGTKEEVQARIKKRLDDNPHLKDNPAFSGLLGRGKRSMQPQLLSHSAPSSVSQSLTGVEVPKTPDIQLPIAPVIGKTTSSIGVATPCVRAPNTKTAATACPTSTNALVVGTSSVVPTTAHLLNLLAVRQRSRAHTPYVAEAWSHFLSTYNLLSKYPSIPQSIHDGFIVHAPRISRSLSPSNKPSITQYLEAFHEIIDKELAKGRYIGPFTREDIEKSLGPFQTSPLSIIPKAGKPVPPSLVLSTHRLTPPLSLAHGALFPPPAH
ncbi:hypothetical protein V8B97DRAFT_1435108 [Scleroderma yunnanense]